VQTYLTISGARENNLKNISLSIAHNSLTVITGLSGSGKSTLAFDTIYAEGGRRYIETFSPYTRQFLDRLPQPELDSISGIRPALALEQRNRITSARSTVGTITEINDYLKIIWGNLASLYCPNCKILVTTETPHTATAKLIESASKTKNLVLYLGFEITRSSASTSALCETLLAEGHSRFFSYSSNTIKTLEPLDSELNKLKKITIIVDRLKTSSSQTLNFDRLRSSLTQTFAFGHGNALALFLDNNQVIKIEKLSQHRKCKSCATVFPPIKSANFSFNSPLGACSTCQGFGHILKIDPDLCIPDPNKTIEEKALTPWGTESTKNIFKKLKDFCKEEQIPTSIAWSKLSDTDKSKVLYGHKKFKGLNGWFERLQSKRHKMHVRVLLSRFRGEFVCTECDGNRLKPQALNYKLLSLTLPEFCELPIETALLKIQEIEQTIQLEDPTKIPLSEAKNRLQYLNEIGLSYLTLNRTSKTLSGGESQRVNLTAILGAQLTNAILVLDEPTIGLHPKDTTLLIKTLKDLQSRGNTLIVVEHEKAVIEAADEVIELGPESGNKGGELIYQGTFSQLVKNNNTHTGRAFNRDSQLRHCALKNETKQITIKNAHANNLKNIDVKIPLDALTVISGASGSGKSSLIQDCLIKPYEKLKAGLTLEQIKASPNIPVDGILGLEFIDQIISIDQNPIGRSSRSNPATYSGAWDIIRDCLAETTGAQQLGLSKSAFSFNVDGGRCPTCKGTGQIKIEMQFLADVFVECEICQGMRFQDKVLNINYAGKNVLEILNLSLQEALELFSSQAEKTRADTITKLLTPFISLGLGYLKLGHPLNSVSGGEAQRIKLASYLSPGFKEKCLFVLDEPTTGLHPKNIEDLISALYLLISNNHSILCVEHNLDLIKQADWIIDLGPEGGERGGEIVATGTPKELASRKKQFKKSSTAFFLDQKNNGSETSTADNSINKHKHFLPPIKIVNAKEHNLKNVSVDIPQNKLIAITGVSGSGKSTLAFDIIFAEGQRRYIDCLSPYARQYIKQLKIADIDQLKNIPPTIAVSQKSAPPLGVSTVATTTELYQYLRLLFAKLGTQHCIHDNTPITSHSQDAICSEITRKFENNRIFLLAPVVRGRKGHYRELFERALKAEIYQALIDNKLTTITDETKLERHKIHDISLVVASMTVSTKNISFLKEAVEQCLIIGNGSIEIFSEKIQGLPSLFNIARVCPKCGTGYRELDPQDFSFRSQRGCCTTCQGTGEVAKKNTVSSCPDCLGSRIKTLGRFVYIEGKTIYDLARLSAPELLRFIQQLSFSKRLTSIAETILPELKSKLELIISVGLDYLELDRNSSSLSGGEAQRLRLAKTLSSSLTGVCYILDEPSIGLHPSDHKQLMQTLFKLRDMGNTVIVVEHDEETIRLADYIVDVGPGGGSNGGKVIYAGELSGITSVKESITGNELNKRSIANSLDKKISSFNKEHQVIELKGASANNLKNIDVKIPINSICAIAGVSGAGKSSLIHQTLVPAIIEELKGEKEREKNYKKTWASLSIPPQINRIIEIDQSPAGKTNTSTPASFLGILDEIRKLYSRLPEAKIRGWNASHFSFNTGKGRCPDCNGKGENIIPMSFLPNATMKCESCNGLRYTEETLECTFQGLSLGSLFKKTFAEASTIFINHRKIKTPIDNVLALGLEYLTLGQATYTLSGGETQRLKIAKELGTLESTNTIYILDEPTIGLHMSDVKKLINVLNNLTKNNNSIIIIEHNLDVLRLADYIIELGPQAGKKGGTLLFQGTPNELSKIKGKTPTSLYL
jgi:excinuclease ABC subunit A